MRPKTRAIVLGAALVTGAAVAGIDWNQYIQKRYPNGSPVPPLINTKQTTLSGGTPLPVSCASGNVSSCMATANQNLLVSACKEVNATPVTAPTASTNSQYVSAVCPNQNWQSLIVNSPDKQKIINDLKKYSNSTVSASEGTAILVRESGGGNPADFNFQDYSPGGIKAVGPMQLIPRWHPGEPLNTVSGNMQSGMAYLQRCANGPNTPWGSQNLSWVATCYHEGQPYAYRHYIQSPLAIPAGVHGLNPAYVKIINNKCLNK